MGGDCTIVASTGTITVPRPAERPLRPPPRPTPPTPTTSRPELWSLPAVTRIAASPPEPTSTTLPASSSTGVINRTGAGAYSSWLRRGSGNVVLATSPIARPDRNGGGRQPHTTFDPWRSPRLIQGSATGHPRPANSSTNRRRGGEEEFIQQESVRAIYTPRGREPALRRNADSQR
jgi:hypothetical protein